MPLKKQLLAKCANSVHQTKLNSVLRDDPLKTSNNIWYDCYESETALLDKGGFNL